MEIPKIKYDDKGVYVDDSFVPCENPRLEFLRRLKLIRDDGKMIPRGNSLFHSRVTYDPRKITVGGGCVIGDYGFGFEYDEKGVLLQMPHLGGVIIEDGVQIKNCVCIDRGVIGDTVIGEGTKIDNLVHIAHGAKIGKYCLIVAGAVIGGSCEIGDRCFIGINASIKNKVKIGNNVTVGMGAIITKDIPDGVTVIGVNKIL